MMYGEATKRAPKDGEIYRVRPRFESGYTLTTRADLQDMTDPANVAQVLRETAADADELRDILKDWIDGNYGIADNERGELEALRALIGNMGIVMANAAHVLAKCAARSDVATTWNGLDTAGMAGVLDEIFGAGTFDDDEWDEWFKTYGSPYRMKRKAD